MPDVENAYTDVEAMIRVGVSFEHIEEYIEKRTDLVPDMRNVLWLYAWVETDAGQRRAVVRDLVNAQTAA